MLQSGLVSVTFRKLSPREIVALVRQAGLDAIEWGGDIHVPHGGLARAKEVRQVTVEAGLAVSSYGSYYRIGEAKELPFEPVLASAVALGAPMIRAWAGRRGSADVSAPERAAMVDDILRIAALAHAAGVGIALEFHGNSLTDTNESACRLLQETTSAGVGIYWQTNVKIPFQSRLDGLRAVLPRLVNLHVFQWDSDYHRFPLADGEKDWSAYLAAVAGTGRDHFALMEFVRDDNPECFLQDSATLREWLKKPRNHEEHKGH